MVEHLTQDNGVPSSLRKNLERSEWALIFWITLVIIGHMFVFRQPVSDLFSYGFLTFCFGMLAINRGSKIGQKFVENQKDIQLGKNGQGIPGV